MIDLRPHAITLEPLLQDSNKIRDLNSGIVLNTYVKDWQGRINRLDLDGCTGAGRKGQN